MASTAAATTTTTTATSTLAPCCGLCGIKDNLLRCSRCKVMFYCCRDHQMAGADIHKLACKLIKSRQDRLERKEEAMEMHPRELAYLPPNVYTKPIGNFWVKLGDYIKARNTLDAILVANTYDAVQSGLDHLMDLLDSCRCDTIGMGNRVPALLLRLGRDQECYDFIKFYAITFEPSEYVNGLKDLPFLDIKNANVLESLFEENHLSNLCLHHMVAVTLLKVKLLLDCIDLQHVRLLRNIRLGDDQDLPALPEEIVRSVYSVTRRSKIHIFRDKNNMIPEEVAKVQSELSSQVQQLYDKVEHENKHVWPAFLNREVHHLTAEPEPSKPPSTGSIKQMQSVVRASMDSWLETPGALDFIQKLRSG